MIDQEFEDDPQVEAAKFLLNPDEDRAVDPETQARLEQLLQAAGKTNLKFFITKIRIKKTILNICSFLLKLPCIFSKNNHF